MIVSQEDVLQAMAHYERVHVASHGPLDGVTLPKNCSKLADLLGLMWFHQEAEATVPDDSALAALIIEARPGSSE